MVRAVSLLPSTDARDPFKTPSFKKRGSLEKKKKSTMHA